ncbi:MAG: hypothetical protein IE878_00925 [Epsilonproteobacteria bacterium]|nr:hypothetical protein [Campylobacterota bacterium]MBD3838936.1 hypothetical protein [Campylobacterota bacterium]
MQQNEIDIEALKKDKEFLANMEQLENEMRIQNSVAMGYKLLDVKLVLESDDEVINEIFTFIVNTAFDKLSDKLTAFELFDMSNEEDASVARAIYEYGIQRWSEHDMKNSKEIFLVLHHMINNKMLQDAMMIHASIIHSGNGFEEFIASFVDGEHVLNESSEFPFFITNFKNTHEELLEVFANDIAQLEIEIKKFAKKD